MDDIEARLHARLERLAAAVPVRSSDEVVVERVRPSAALLRPASATLLVAALLVAAVAVGLGLASRLTTPATSGGPSAIIPASPPIESTSPAPSPSNAGASLVISTTVEEPCPPTEGGGCHYAAVLRGPGGKQWEWDLLADGTVGRPSALAPGTYTLRLEARYGSDIIVNGSPAPAGTDAVCATSYVVTPATTSVPVTAAFARGACTVVVGSEHAPTQPPAGIGLPYPDGCAAYRLSIRRCAYIVAWAEGQVGIDPSSRVTVELLGDPLCAAGTTNCGIVRTTTFIVRVRLIAPDGASADYPVFCGIGGDRSLLCTETPVIGRSSPTISGYHDVPCAGEAPENPCASPVATADPSAVRSAVPLEVPRLEIPIDHTGEYVIPVGEAVLPNGILTEATFGVEDESPTDLLVAPEGVYLEVTSLEGGPPFVNAYDHGWRPGTERVRVDLRFTVESFDPGAVLVVTTIVVR